MEKTSSAQALLKQVAKGAMTTVASLLAVALVGLIIFRIGFVTYIQQHEMPYKFDRLTGKIEKLPRTGYIIAAPFVTEVYGIDLRPRQVLLNVGGGGSYRVLNAKLVQFDPNGFDEFVKLHGLQSGDVSDILKIYAFDQENRGYPFLKVSAGTISLQ